MKVIAIKDEEDITTTTICGRFYKGEILDTLILTGTQGETTYIVGGYDVEGGYSLYDLEHWKDYFITLAEYREKRIDEILNDPE